MKTNVYQSIAMFDLYKAKNSNIMLVLWPNFFLNIMRQAGNEYLPIAIFAKGNNAIFILKLKLEIT